VSREKVNVGFSHSWASNRLLRVLGSLYVFKKISGFKKKNVFDSNSTSGDRFPKSDL
jgi:hypothetical protein